MFLFPARTHTHTTDRCITKQIDTLHGRSNDGRTNHDKESKKCQHFVDFSTLALIVAFRKGKKAPPNLALEKHQLMILFGVFACLQPDSRSGES